MPAVALGISILVLRPPASWIAVAMTGLVGVLGVLVPLPDIQSSRASWWMSAIVLIVGVGAFAAVRVSVPSIPAVPFWLPAVGATLLAAFAEEAFFRRLMYSWLISWGEAVAIAVSAVAFAAVHVPTYGLAILPLDCAAGLIFGWQRWATGSWLVPALAHSAANLMMLR